MVDLVNSTMKKVVRLKFKGDEGSRETERSSLVTLHSFKANKPLWNLTVCTVGSRVCLDVVMMSLLNEPIHLEQ